MILEFFPFIRKKFCIVFFLCVINFFQSQIFQANSSTLYISEGASIIDVYKENTDKIEVNIGKIFVSKNTLVCTDKNTISAQVVLIESHKKASSTKKHLVFIPKLKKLDSGKIAEPIKKSDFNFIGGKSDEAIKSSFESIYAALQSSQHNSKSTPNAFFEESIKILLKNSNKGIFYKNIRLIHSVKSTFKTRPPPSVLNFS